ncbi:hypothetical protein GCM10022285_39910 [Streptomyces tunisiensis]|uniref:Uncharacterized protein n=1 Tax=Streptomyces tunisiensis TaxID=948699 RepID=A0ABP7YS33_9ACTN
MRPLMQPALTEPSLSLTRQAPDAQGAPVRPLDTEGGQVGERSVPPLCRTGPDKDEIRSAPIRSRLDPPDAPSPRSVAVRGTEAPLTTGPEPAAQMAELCRWSAVG